MTQTRCFKEALAKVRALFAATPDLSLTTADTARMSGLDRQVCRVALRTLTEEGLLERRGTGLFVLGGSKDATKRASSPPPPASSR